tara:strand:+ start:303 stop:653 length:351 start_codon:yes stop_codon:yes gene_type:complete
MEAFNHQSAHLIPVLGILAGIIIPVSVFIWLYFDAKNKQKTILEISKNLDNPNKVEELLKIFEEIKKEPIDFRRNGVITLFTGAGFYFFGLFLLGSIMKAKGALISLIGLGTVIAA